MSNSFSLETISPIAISKAKGSSLSASKHFLYDADNHEVCYLDQAALLDKVKDAGQEVAFRNSSGSLRAFLRDRLKLGEFDIEALILHRRPANGFRANTVDRIQQAEVNQGAPTILHNQLSEAIRAATLYDWLKSEKETGGKKQLEEWVIGIESCYEACRSFFPELKMLQESHRRSPRRLDKNSLDRKNTLEAEIRDRLETNLKLTDRVLFGETGASQIRLTASPVFESKALEVQAIGKINIENGDLSNIKLHEAVSIGAKTSFELVVEGTFAHPHLAKWSEDPKEELISILYDHAYDLVEFEREYIDELIQENKHGEGDFTLHRNQQENLENLRNFYDNLLEDKLDEASDNQAFLRLRTDGGYLGQTLGLALFQQNADAYDHFQILYGMMPGKTPVAATYTDAVLKLGQKRGRRQDANISSLLGWVKIQS